VDELGAGRVGDLPLERVAVLRLGGFLPPRDVRTDIKGVGGAGQAGPDFRELGKNSKGKKGGAFPPSLIFCNTRYNFISGSRGCCGCAFVRAALINFST
jgi:hypothetical protein